MQVRKFEAASLDEALYQVKSELGPDALILASRPIKTRWLSKSTIEVTAAAQAPKQKPTSLEAVFDENSLVEIFPHRRKSTAVADSEIESVQAPKKSNTRYVDIAGVRPKKTGAHKIEERFNSLGVLPETARDLAHQLHYDYPQKDLTSTPFLEKAMARILSRKIHCSNPDILLGNGEWVPIGLSGSGKTTLLVKMALMARGKNLKSALVSLDSSRLMARESMYNYARLIRVPFYSAKNFARSSEMIKYFDCPSLPLSGSDEEWDKFEKAISGRRSFLVVDATMRLPEANRLLEQVSRFSPTGIAFTKVDLCRQLGPMFEFLRLSELPLLALSVSQSFKVPMRFLDEKEFSTVVVKQGVIE